jgi:3'-phosphoadenosine 5'-phosphosulfate sulfotransferase (PAPS reductase)/FAD synthetase
MLTTALQFSGGKDSLACLYLLRPHWQELLVVWADAGAAYPETVELMEQVRAMVPHFLVVRSDVHADIKAHGYPSDIVPSRHTAIGKVSRTDVEGPTLRAWAECCARNVWVPMHQALKARGITTIIRGQRDAEAYKAPVRDGDMVDGITYRMPIQTWSEEEVRAYLTEVGALPAHYADTTTSLDCWVCTAYLDEKRDQVAYLKEKHPELHAIVRGRLAQILRASRAPISDLEALAG